MVTQRTGRTREPKRAHGGGVKRVSGGGAGGVAARAKRGGVAPDPFAALADPTRRAILDGLRQSARTAGDIASDFSISRPGVSKHLRVLTGAGLVRVVKHGRERRYHLAAGPLEGVDAWVSRYRMFWAASLMRLKEVVEGESEGEGEERH